MIFNKNLYYNKIKQLEDINYIKAIIITIAFILIAVIINILIIKIDLILAIIFGLIIGILAAYNNYIKNQYKIEELKMKLDIYNMLEEIKDSQK